MQQVVFNAHYLAWCDDAMETWIRGSGIDVLALGWDFMLKRAVLEWQGSASVGETVDIDVGMARWGTTSFDIGFSGTVDGRPVFTARVTYVGVQAGTTRTMRPPDEVRKILGEAGAAAPT